MDRPSHAPPRRLSYASVASGAAGPRPILSTSASTSHPPQYAEQRYGRRQSSLEQETGGISYRKPASLPSYSRRFNHLPGLTGYGASGFFVPDYLRESRYVAKLETEHMARTKKERQNPSGAPSNAPSLSSSATNANVHKIAPSHRGMTYDVIESNPPKEQDELMPLPSRWSEQDRYPGLDISSNGLEVKYSGQPSKADIEAASVRADYPMSPACGLYYFEVTVNSKSKDTAIAIGFSTSEASLERLPGWETHSWGYHGDDGKMFSGEHAGRSYGPTFSANDVVGCGIDFNLGQAFFTLNGRDLDVCFRELKDLRPFPTIGMKKYSGASVTVNFGQRPFVFDIQGKMDAAKDSVRSDIEKAKTNVLSSGMDENTLIQTLVAQYLAHDGYVETARAFTEELTREKNALNSAQPGAAPKATAPDDTEAVHRQSKHFLR
jgi:Ran-binding protein 9/10